MKANIHKNWKAVFPLTTFVYSASTHMLPDLPSFANRLMYTKFSFNCHALNFFFSICVLNASDTQPEKLNHLITKKGKQTDKQTKKKKLLKCHLNEWNYQTELLSNWIRLLFAFYLFNFSIACCEIDLFLTSIVSLCGSCLINSQTFI